MAKLFQLDTTFSPGTDMPTLQTLEDYEARIAALTPRAWWDASNIAYRTDVSGKCSQLTDRSGNGFHLLQATSGNRPVVTTDYWGALHGVHRDAVVFDGSTDLFMETAGNVFDGTTVWTVAMLIKPTAGGTPLSTAASLFNFYPNLTTQFSAPFGGIAVNLSTLTKLAAIGTYNYPGSGSVAETLDVNGVTASGTQALGSTAPGTSHAILGAFQAAHSTSRFAGGIGEYLIFKADLSSNPTAIAMLKAYFAMKYR